MTNEVSEIRQRPSLKVERFQVEQLNDWATQVPTSKRRLFLLAAAVIITIFGFGGVWSATAKIGGAVFGSGRVIASGNNQIVDHLEGGILKEIDVVVGDTVKAGQVLAVLDTTSIKSQLVAAQKKHALLQVELARWRAASVGAGTFEVKRSNLAPMADDPRVREAIRSQGAELEASLNVLKKTKSMLDAKISAEGRDIASARAAIKGYDEQLSLISQQHQAFAELYSKGLIAQSRVLSLEQSTSQLTAQRTTAMLTIQKSNDNIDAYDQPEAADNF